MNRVELDDIKDDCEFYFEEFAKFPPPKAPDAEYCGLLTQAFSQRRRLAITILLADADRHAFLTELRKSGPLRVTVLQMANGQKEGFAQWARQGIVGPFFDAWTAGDDDTARQIATLSQLPPQPDYEYIEDYCYARWWYALALAGQVNAELEARFTELEEATDDDTDPRVMVCRAVMSRDPDLFADGMEKLSQAHIEWYKERTADPAENRTEGAVFIEGLALVRLAHVLGVAAPTEYHRVPSALVFGTPAILSRLVAGERS